MTFSINWRYITIGDIKLEEMKQLVSDEEVKNFLLQNIKVEFNEECQLWYILNDKDIKIKLWYIKLFECIKLDFPEDKCSFSQGYVIWDKIYIDTVNYFDSSYNQHKIYILWDGTWEYEYHIEADRMLYDAIQYYFEDFENFEEKKFNLLKKENEKTN